MLTTYFQRRVARECQKDRAMGKAVPQDHRLASTSVFGADLLVMDALAAQFRPPDEAAAPFSTTIPDSSDAAARGRLAGYNGRAAPLYGGERQSVVAVA